MRWGQKAWNLGAAPRAPPASQRSRPLLGQLGGDSGRPCEEGLPRAPVPGAASSRALCTFTTNLEAHGGLWAWLSPALCWGGQPERQGHPLRPPGTVVTDTGMPRSDEGPGADQGIG